jgi:hypothetical protein
MCAFVAAKKFPLFSPLTVTIRTTHRSASGATTAIRNSGASGVEENSRIESIEKIDLATDTAANTLKIKRHGRAG